MNKSLVCRVLVPLSNRSYASISTGYAVKQGVVLLSRHALLHEDRDSSLAIKLIWDEWKDALGKPCEIEAEQGSEIFVSEQEHLKSDIALLKCQTPPHAPINCCPLFPERFTSNLSWEAYGFPKVKQIQAGDLSYEATTVLGHTKSSNHNGCIELYAKDDFSDRNLWAGISGAAIFHDTYLIGVITSNWLEHKNSLEGYSLAYHVRQCQLFAKTLELTTEDDTPTYLPLFEPILVKVPNLAKQLDAQSSIKSADLYRRLVAVSVGEFFQKLLSCRQTGGCPKTLGELATVLLPQFVAPEIVNYVRDQTNAHVLPVPYSRGVVIESLMARVDRRVVAIDHYANNRFTAKYALSWAAETAERTEDRVRETMQDMDARYGGDLLELHTKQLYKKTKPSDVPDSQGDRDQMERRVKRLLQSANKRNAPRHYLVHDDFMFGSFDAAQQYYTLLKMKYPECIVLKPTSDEDLIHQELDDYFDAEQVLAPYINGETN